MTQHSAQSEQRPEKGAGRVLVVDDVAANARLLAGILKVSGFEVITCGGGLEALDRLENTSPDAPLPDVVLLDIMMPDMDGFEVCRRLRAQPRTAHLPIVMVTAIHETSARIAALDAGADDFLSKPVDEIEVVARVKNLLRVKKSRDELEHTLAQLRRAEEMRDNLTAMLVHDLRTPLTAMMMPLDLLRQHDAELDADTRRQLVAICGRSANRLLDLINDLLDTAKMEAGELKLDLADVDAETLAEEAVEQIGPLCQEGSVTVTREVPPQTPHFRADDGLLRRVLVNLLANAVRFAPLNSAVEVRAWRDDLVTFSASRAWHGSPLPPLREAMLFSVRDQGPGISPGEQARIWDKFAQAEARRGGKRMASGLGLTFCRLVVEAHGGGIWVESQPGQGSTFIFAVPVGGKDGG